MFLITLLQGTVVSGVTYPNLTKVFRRRRSVSRVGGRVTDVRRTALAALNHRIIDPRPVPRNMVNRKVRDPRWVVIVGRVEVEDRPAHVLELRVLNGQVDKLVVLLRPQEPPIAPIRHVTVLDRTVAGDLRRLEGGTPSTIQVKADSVHVETTEFHPRDPVGRGVITPVVLRSKVAVMRIVGRPVSTTTPRLDVIGRLRVTRAPCRPTTTHKGVLVEIRRCTVLPTDMR